MASTAPTQSQQGVTKTLSGPNAVFKDKVYVFTLLLIFSNA